MDLVMSEEIIFPYNNRRANFVFSLFSQAAITELVRNRFDSCLLSQILSGI